MCSKCEWVLYLQEIDDLLVSGDYDFAQDTLEGIKDWVEKNEHITAGQIKAINNIEESII